MQCIILPRRRCAQLCPDQASVVLAIGAGTPGGARAQGAGPSADAGEWQDVRVVNMEPVGPYEFAGRDLGAFVADWLVQVQREDAPTRGLLEHIDEGYDYGGHFLMANIGPQATEPEASEETLLLYAVMAAYQNDAFPGASVWQGEEQHVRRAFAYARGLGASCVASNLLHRSAEASRREPAPELERLRASSLGKDPVRRAAHDRRMASIADRDIRAAKLLDDSQSIDDFILGIVGGQPGNLD